MPELIWEGKYDAKNRKVAPLRVSLPFQTVETINESTQDRQRSLDLFAGGLDPDWRNRLIWGDKKYVLPALLDEFAGRVDLVYVDPPFFTGDNFTYRVQVGDDDFTKTPSMVEEKAYRDTWGRGLDGYLQWFFETCLLLRDLLSDVGSIYVHLDWHVGPYAKTVLDEVFGLACFQNEIAWCYREAINSTKRWNRKHDTIFFYTRDPEHWCFNANEVLQPHSPVTIAKYKYEDEQGRYRLMGRGLSGSPIRSARDVAPDWEKTNPELVYRHYLRSGTYAVDYWNIDIINQASHERVGFPTQKPEALLERIIKASSNEGDLVLDCFAGSGTTAVVAEKLGRRWISADLSRFGIHTTRKRLLSISQVRPFVVENLGKYERQLWQTAEFGDQADARTRAYRNFILELYKAKPIEGYVWLHGAKTGAMVHVGTVDAPVTVGDVKQIAAEFRKAIGTGDEAPKSTTVDVLGWDFAFELNEVARQEAALANILMRFIRIPREVLDRRAVEQGDVRFFELAALSIDIAIKGRVVSVRLADFMIPLDDVPDEIQREVKTWTQWVDYWAVDWNNQGDTFHNEWQTYRTRQEKKLETEIVHEYEAAGSHRLVVKVVDILGNDTTKTLEVEVT